jgi:hypothetical protein
MMILPALFTLAVATNVNGGSHDFDFLAGPWTIHNRRLRERLKGSDVWDEFTATHVSRRLLNGLGNEDEYRTDFWLGYVGMAFRFFNPETNQWSIYWADSRRGVLDPAVVGGFSGPTGVFVGEDTFEGRRILVRFIWSRVDTPTPHWEQAFSADGGTTWETNWTMDFTRADVGAEGRCCAVIELRQYTLKPGRRDELIDLFDREFVESQEEVGMTVIGQFRDRVRPDRFVWLRGFSDTAARRDALERFYGGPVWAAHRGVANDTMIDSNDVLLLKPARPTSGFRFDRTERPARGDERPGQLVFAGIHPLGDMPDDTAISAFERIVQPALGEAGVNLDAVFLTESAPNSYPRLPVREGEHVLVWFGTISAGVAAQASAVERAMRGLQPVGAPTLLELEPSSRSWYGRQP